jgi:isoleucyl-tRNA synthetase
VKEELNVGYLEKAQPDDFSSMMVQPNFQALGRRLGKDMGAVTVAIKALSHDQIQRFQKEGSLTVAGHTFSLDDV